MELKHWCRHSRTGLCNVHNFDSAKMAKMVKDSKLELTISNATYIINTFLNQVWRISV